MADFDFTNLTIQECIEAKALLDDRLEELGEGKSYKSLEQKAMVLRQVKENFASFLAQYGITLTSDKVSSEWVEKMKQAVNVVLTGGSTLDIIDAETTILNTGRYSGRAMRSLTCPNVRTIKEGSCCGAIALSSEILSSPNVPTLAIGPSRYYYKTGQYLEEINFPKCTRIESFSNTNYSPTFEMLGAFAYRTQLTTINMPLLEEINGSAFTGCIGLIEVTLPSLKKCGIASWTYSSKGVFDGCSNLITLNAPLTTIGARAFYNCSKLQNINLENVTNIGNFCFYGCSSLKEIVMPKIINIIDSGGNNPTNFAKKCLDLEVFSLSNCESPVVHGIDSFENLRVVNLAKAPRYSVFHNSNTSLLVPLEEFEGYALKYMERYQFNGFFNNPNLKMWDLEFPLVETALGYIFKDCTGLKNIKMPLLKGLSGYSFSNCSNLETCCFPLANIISGSTYTFQNCYKIRTVVVKTTSFPNYTFQNCYVLKNLINKNNGVATIGYKISSTSTANPFYNCYKIQGTTNETYNHDGEVGNLYVGNEEMTKADQEALVASYYANTVWASSAPATLIKPYYMLQLNTEACTDLGIDTTIDANFFTE